MSQGASSSKSKRLCHSESMGRICLLCLTQPSSWTLVLHSVNSKFFVHRTATLSGKSNMLSCDTGSCLKLPIWMKERQKTSQFPLMLRCTQRATRKCSGPTHLLDLQFLPGPVQITRPGVKGNRCNGFETQWCFFPQKRKLHFNTHTPECLCNLPSFLQEYLCKVIASLHPASG